MPKNLVRCYNFSQMNLYTPYYTKYNNDEELKHKSFIKEII